MTHIHLGSRVQLEIDNEPRTFRIIEGSHLPDDPGIITAGSQVGSVLMGKTVGDRFEIVTEGKTHAYTVLAIDETSR